MVENGYQFRAAKCILLLIALLGQSAMAANVTLSNFPGSQVELVPGSSPDFTQLLTDFAGAEAVQSLLPVTPYLVIAKNNSTASIYSITMIWRWQGQGADQIYGPSVTHIMKPGCRPGQAILMAPISGLSTPLIKPEEVNGTRPAIHSQPDLNKILDFFFQTFKPMANVSIELDSVIFQDHTYLGTDHSRGIGKEQTARQMLHQLATDLLRLAPSDRMAYLQAIIDAGTKQPQSITVDASERARFAQAMKGQVNGAGTDEALFRRSMENIVYNETQPLRRRQEQ